MNADLSARGFTKHFPVRRRPFSRDAAAVRARCRRRRPRHRGERNAGAGRRERQRQDHAGHADPRLCTSRPPAPIRGRGRAALRSLPADERLRFRRDVQVIFQDPYGSLNPRLTVRSILARPLRLHGIVPQDLDREAARLLELVGLRPAARLHRPLSARVLRRPAPAHRDRAGAGAQAAGDRRRRAGLGARCVRPRADPARCSPSSGATFGICDAVHHPRSRRRALHRRPRRRDVSRQDRGDGAARDLLRSHPSSLLAHAARLRAIAKSRRSASPTAHIEVHRRAAVPDRSAVRLPFSHPLPLRFRSLREARSPFCARSAPGHCAACHLNSGASPCAGCYHEQNKGSGEDIMTINAT